VPTARETVNPVKYDPVKNMLAAKIRHSPLLRKLFYKALGLLFLREWYVKRAVRLAFPDPSRPLSVLDAGAGFGQYSYFCARRYPHAGVLAVEINPDHVRDGNAFAQRTGMTRIRFHEADITALDLENEFDLVMNVDVMEHIEHDVSALVCLSRSLKPGGKLILSTPAATRSHQEDGDFVGEHFRNGYTAGDIRQKLADAGFSSVAILYGYGFWGDMAWRLGIRNAMRLAGCGWIGKMAAVLYLSLLLPLVLILMGCDFLWKNKSGTSLLVTAVKASGS